MPSTPATDRLAKRALRLVARVVGLPLGVGTLWLLRLSGRKAGIALMYHSVDESPGDPLRELVPPHGLRLFEQQVRHVVRHYRVVEAERLHEAVASRRRGQRFPLAITFDDDLACHARVALPVLRAAGATATFFLSGASLERPFAFWYERLQRAFDEALPGVAELATGRAGAGEASIHALGLELERMRPEERDAAAQRLADVLGPDPEHAGIRAAQVRELAAAGMTIGFHTHRHDSLAWLDDDRLAAAMVDGRVALEAAAGAPLRTIGYPHGRADERVAAAAQEAGFTAGFTTEERAVTPRSDPLLQGRVGPSLRSLGATAALLALTLARS